MFSIVSIPVQCNKKTTSMPAFNKNLNFDFLLDADPVDDQHHCDTDESVSCKGFELRINNLLDKRARLSSDHSLQEHAEDCSNCWQVLQQYQQLELLLGGERQVPNDADKVCLRDDLTEVTRTVDSLLRVNRKRAFGWGNLSLRVMAMLAGLLFIGLYFNDATDVESVPDVATTKTSQVLSAGHLMASLVGNNPNENLPWASNFSVQQLRELIDSGSELLAASEEQVLVIRGLSDVKFDLRDIESHLESQLESLQPVLSYSGRIPAFSPMQGTVCFTLGWLKKGKTNLQPTSSDSMSEVGMNHLVLKNLV